MGMEQDQKYKEVLWAVTWPKDDGDRVDPEFVYSTLEEAQEMVNDCYGRGVIIPLYIRKQSEQ